MRWSGILIKATVIFLQEVTEENKEKWYKRMYDSLHKAGKDGKSVISFVSLKYNVR